MAHFPQTADSSTIYRNFNLCPHCIFQGEQGLLCRLCEGMPMISRSDGKTFHLLLADQPLPYPAERESGLTKRISVCFWYSHIRIPQATLATIVLLPPGDTQSPSFFRLIESVADLLALELKHRPRLGSLYQLDGSSLAELTY